MPTTKKEPVGERTIAIGKMDGRTNGSRNTFRTDTAISNNRFSVHEKVLQPWVPDSKETVDGSLEKSSSAGRWDQFATNEKLFGLKTDYDENIYTTAINKNHPQYRERIAAAEKKAREIERSAAATTHVAEERVMDYVGGKGDENEEDKYSGVRRQQDFPPLNSGRENRYTPPAKRAPTGQATVKGAPVDPAIISSQIKLPKKQPAQAAEQPKPQTPQSEPSKNVTPVPKVEIQKPADAKSAELKPVDAKPAPAKPAAPAQEQQPQEKQTAEQVAASSRPAQGSARNTQPTIPVGAPSATLTVERDVLNSFKSFAMQQRLNAEKVRANKVKVDKEGRLTELKKFAISFKLSTPVPKDLVSIIAKDPAKQKEIQAKAIKNAQEVAKARSEAAQAKKAASETKEQQPKQPKQPEQAPAAAAPQDTRQAAPRPAPAGPQATPSGTGPNRHPGPRQQFGQQYHAAPGFRGNRTGAQQHAPPQHGGGHLAQRLRNVEQQKFAQPPPVHQHAMPAEVRVPPTGPANAMDPAYPRRHNGHLGAKLNPNSNEFRPSPFAASFSPNGHPSAGSSPRVPANPMVVDNSNPPHPFNGQLIRRKTKAVDVAKCNILSHTEQIKPPAGRNWDDNGGLRPSYDTLPTWRQLQDDEKEDSIMRLTWREYFERNPFSGPSMPTPNPTHVVPQMPHQHQLPFHLQHGAHNLPPRQSPHMPPMPMHAAQHGPVPHQPYGNDDHRMMHSNSAQSYASPRLGQLPVSYQGMNPPGQVPYSQPIFLNTANGQMAQYRAYGNSHYGPPHGQMGQPMLIQPQFMPGPHGMMAAPHMMYPGAHHHQFMPPSGPPQPMTGANGYPSPGRPAAPMMAHQGSQQGQNNGANNAGGGNMYTMSPGVQYNQPNYGPGQTNAPVNNVRPFAGPGPQPFTTSPQTQHSYMGPNGNHPGKPLGPPVYHPGPQANHGQGGPRLPQGRAADSSEESK